MELDRETIERLARAEASTTSAHHRLDGYNGQINGLRTEVANLRVEMASLKTKTAGMAAIGAALGTAVMGAIVTVVVAALGG
jgi:hypothetical protein